MKLGTPFDVQLRRTAIGGWTAETFNQLTASLLASFHREHDPETDRHSTIQATGSISERSRTVAQGVWIAVPFGALSFTGSGGMTWTVAVASYKALAYTLVGMTMTVSFDFQTTSVTAPLGSVLSFTIPGGFTAKRTNLGTFWYSDNGVQGIGATQVTAWPGAGASTIDLYTGALGNWTASVNNTRVFGTLTFEVN